MPLSPLPLDRLCIHQVTLMQCGFRQSMEILAGHGITRTAIWRDKRDGNVDLYLRHNADDTCVADIDGSGAVDFGDLLAMLAAWGACGACPEDLDGSGAVDFTDLVMLLAAWGPCA